MCRQWNRLVWEQPAFWRSLALQRPVSADDSLLEGPALQQWLESKLALVARVSPFLVDVQLEGWVELQGEPSAELAALLQALGATAVRSLQLDMSGELSPGAAAAAASLTSLQHLQLSTQWLRPGAARALLPALRGLQSLRLRALWPGAGAHAALLPALGGLRELHLSSYDPPAVDAAAWGALVQLTWLRLQLYGQEQPPLELDPIVARLPALRRLDAYASCGGPDGLRVPSLACCPTLRTLDLLAPELRVSLGGCCCACRRPAWTCCPASDTVTDGWMPASRLRARRASVHDASPPACFLLTCALQVPGGLLACAQVEPPVGQRVATLHFEAAGEGSKGRLFLHNMHLGSPAALASCVTQLGPAARHILRLQLDACCIQPGALSGLRHAPSGGGGGGGDNGNGGGGSSSAGGDKGSSSELLLPGVRSLMLLTCESDGNGGMEAALAELPRVLPGLQFAVLDGLNLSAGLPRGIRQLSGLRLLECEACRLAAAGGGPWLSSARRPLQGLPLSVASVAAAKGCCPGWYRSHRSWASGRSQACLPTCLALLPPMEPCRPARPSAERQRPQSPAAAGGRTLPVELGGPRQPGPEAEPCRH